MMRALLSATIALASITFTISATLAFWLWLLDRPNRHHFRPW